MTKNGMERWRNAEFTGDRNQCQRWAGKETRALTIERCRCLSCCESQERNIKRWVNN